MKIIAKAIKYYGCLQGYKVYISHNRHRHKFPIEHGRWYTELNKSKAIKDAIKELKKAHDEHYEGNYRELYIDYLCYKEVKR